jgi:hypothetical protein
VSADRWRVWVVYDADGTADKEITGHRVSIQLLRSSRPGPKPCLVKAYDADGKLVSSFQAAVTYSIERSRIDG